MQPTRRAEKAPCEGVNTDHLRPVRTRSQLKTKPKTGQAKTATMEQRGKTPRAWWPDRRFNMNWSSDSRGRQPAGRGGHNPRSRRAVCEQHKYGSVRGAPSDGGPYSINAAD